MTATPTYALAGGGTGGHAYPSLTVGEQLRMRGAGLVYYGSEQGPERALAEDAGITYRSIPASQVRGGPKRILLGSLSMLRGRRVALASLRADRPAALFATGGYAAAPVGWAAPGARVPLLVFLPDVVPGWAVRFLARYATLIACSVDASLRSLPAAKTVVTGYPVRGQFTLATRAEGIARFSLDASLPTLLVTGGSLGAHRINAAIAAALPRLLAVAQVIHICGRDDAGWLANERSELPEAVRERYHLHAYTEQMAWAMAAADLAVTRAGASTLGELPVAGLPAVVVPAGFSDQEFNARYLADRGAAIVVENDALDQLEPEAVRLLVDSDARREMGQAMRGLARADAATRLATLMEEIAA